MSVKAGNFDLWSIVRAVRYADADFVARWRDLPLPQDGSEANADAFIDAYEHYLSSESAALLGIPLDIRLNA